MRRDAWFRRELSLAAIAKCSAYQVKWAVPLAKKQRRRYATGGKLPLLKTRKLVAQGRRVLLIAETWLLKLKSFTPARGVKL